MPKLYFNSEFGRKSYRLKLIAGNSEAGGRKQAKLFCTSAQDQNLHNFKDTLNFEERGKVLRQFQG